MAYISPDWGTSNPNINYRLVIELLSQDIVANTSTINVQLQAWRLNNYTTYGTGVASVNVEGTQYDQGIDPSQKIQYYSYTTLYNANHTIIHNADGTKTASIGGYFSINSPVEGGWDSFSFTLPTIPRASSVTATNADIESATSININRYSGSFTHTLKYSFGALNGTIVTKTTQTSYGWTVPSSFYAQIPNAISGTCTITCETYSGNTLIGTSSCTFTVSVNPQTNAPIVSATITDSNSTTVALTGNNANMVKFYSNAAYSISATAKNSASIVSRLITCGSLSGSAASGTLTAVESGTFVVSATDSRGITTTVTYTKTLVDYIKLTQTPVLARVTPTGSTISINISGNYFNGSFGAQANTLTIKYQYREVGGSWPGSYTTISSPTLNGNTYSKQQNLSQVFDYTKAYEFEVQVIDKLGTVTVVQAVSRGIPVFNWDLDEFDVNVDLKIKNAAGALVRLIDLIFPIGKIEITTTSTNPGTYLPGTTWAQYAQGRVIMGVGSIEVNTDTSEGTVTAGSINKTSAEVRGGEKAHTLTTNEMPVHSHSAGGWSRDVALDATGVYAPTKPNGGYDNWGNGGSAGGGQAHNNIPPYTTAYLWKRTA